MLLNKDFLKLQDSYLFITIDQKVKAFMADNPNAKLIKLGIGDVTLPLAPAVIQAMHKAVEDMSKAETFKGYSSDQGYPFLQEAILGYYAKKGVELELDDIFIGDGAKSDISNMLDIFDKGSVALVPDPVYPVYVDTNIMCGRELKYLSGNQANSFLPLPDSKMKADIIYLCSPNNPTGSVYTKDQLKCWVDYALSMDALILFDSAYEIFIDDCNLPSSIYQIPGAKQCAIEICSFSKTAGFTGVRCGYTIVPKELVKKAGENESSVNAFWKRRQNTKFNGVSYITQRGAEAALSDEGFAQIKENAAYYKQNAKIISDVLTELGIWYTGGENSPYVWLKCPGGKSSWEFFDQLLREAHVVGTPGSGFGMNGDGYFRLTAFGARENVENAAKRLRHL
ncbi:MAG: LL-diaminopimelate aminotransferase [Clostridiales bacterium]|nr:LL-diaminopimelate aminotransferase [Clostridiales bacterium]